MRPANRPRVWQSNCPPPHRSRSVRATAGRPPPPSQPILNRRGHTPLASRRRRLHHQTRRRRRWTVRHESGADLGKAASPMYTTSVCRSRASTSSRDRANLPSRWPVVSTRVQACARCVQRYAGVSTDSRRRGHPGTISNGTLAASSAADFLPPRPKMKGSPPFRRTTCRALAGETDQQFIDAILRQGMPPGTSCRHTPYAPQEK